MQMIDIQNPVFRILKDQNRNTIDQATRKAFSNGWIPVGTQAQNGREWFQVMVKEGEAKEDFLYSGAQYQLPGESLQKFKERISMETSRDLSGEAIIPSRKRGNPNWGKKE